MTTRVHAVVRGRVQGVGFRYATARLAEEAGVAGYVRNRPDGAVEAEVEGPDDAVARVADFLRSGPRGAHVTGAEVRAVAPRGEHGFAVR
ncbi:acylphosphatase [Isoptericola aurantiacus]|uniref:acylphosphatase n=1 Tax=Isoptericola aurantiacus TaxID=3377839 RepID=UPI00383A12AA